MFHGEWKRKVSTLIGWLQPEDGKKLKNYGKIFVYTSTTPPTMPAPNNRLELKSKTARDENRNTMTPTQDYAGLITLVLMVQPLRDLGGAERIIRNKKKGQQRASGKGNIKQ